MVRVTSLIALLQERGRDTRGAWTIFLLSASSRPGLLLWEIGSSQPIKSAPNIRVARFPSSPPSFLLLDGAYKPDSHCPTSTSHHFHHLVLFSCSIASRSTSSHMDLDSDSDSDSDYHLDIHHGRPRLQQSTTWTRTTIAYRLSSVRRAIPNNSSTR